MGSPGLEGQDSEQMNVESLPRYHFRPPSNWMNDPNGLIQWKGTYHLFYQYNPNGPLWGTIHWGHARSRDLVHWEHLPVALAPTPGSPDEDGCFSGCTVDRDGVPVVIYTGVRGRDQLPCLAFGDDGLLRFRKHPSNPVIPSPPDDPSILMFRDHTVWHEGRAWYQAIGSGFRDRGGAALLYRSPDLERWEYLGPLCVGDSGTTEPVWTGLGWECPDFFQLGDRHALVVSAWDGAPLYPVYMTGEYRGHIFYPEVVHRLDFGCLYAPQSFRDERGRRVMFGWLREERSEDAQRRAGWSGAMSLPRVIESGPYGGLRAAPAPEVEALRRGSYSLREVPIPPSEPLVLPEGDSFELEAEIEPGEAGEVGLALRRSPAGEEETLITYSRSSALLSVDTRRSSLDPEAGGALRRERLELGPGEPLSLRAFVDRSVVELFADARACCAFRAYPSRSDSLGVRLFARGAPVLARRVSVWEMRP